MRGNHAHRDANRSLGALRLLMQGGPCVLRALGCGLAHGLCPASGPWLMGHHRGGTGLLAAGWRRGCCSSLCRVLLRLLLGRPLACTSRCSCRCCSRG